MRALLIRLEDDGKQTLGELRIYEGTELLFYCKTLELPYRDNKKNVSCIPKGSYLVTKRMDLRSKFKYEHLHIKHVVNRKYILIHVGNFFDDIEGCVLVGAGFYDIDKDGLRDVYSSTVTFENLMFHVAEYDNFILDVV